MGKFREVTPGTLNCGEGPGTGKAEATAGGTSDQKGGVSQMESLVVMQAATKQLREEAKK